MPQNYNVIVQSLTNYGQLSDVGTIAGSTNFGIYPGSTLTAPTIANPTIYSGVFHNIPAISINNTSGHTQISGSNYTWALAENLSNRSQINLVLLALATPTIIQEEAALQQLGLVLVPDEVDTYNSVVALGQAIQWSMTMQATDINNSLSYDCNIFDQHNLYFSVGGRYTSLTSDGANTTAVLLVAAYRSALNWRIGAFVDKSLGLSFL